MFVSLIAGQNKSELKQPAKQKTNGNKHTFVAFFLLETLLLQSFKDLFTPLWLVILFRWHLGYVPLALFRLHYSFFFYKILSCMHENFLRQIIHCLPRLFNRTVETPSIESFVHCEPLNYFSTHLLSFCFLFLLPACEKNVENVCTNSSEEHLQPFKQKMEAFLSTGESRWNLFLFGVKTKCYIYSFSHLKVLIIYVHDVQ